MIKLQRSHSLELEVMDKARERRHEDGGNHEKTDRASSGCL